MLPQIYEWSKAVFDMLFSLQSFFTTGIVTSLLNAPWYVEVLMGPLVYGVLQTLYQSGIDPSLFAILFGTSGVTLIFLFGIFRFVVR